ncbi:hypothetical protein ACJA23_01045 [Mycoplasma corogypsi]|uniref:hypothetical protein n=1 Tax=Mycoplasma corogypsi TaxID=2106 RepID=UPI003873225B
MFCNSLKLSNRLFNLIALSTFASTFLSVYVPANFTSAAFNAEPNVLFPSPNLSLTVFNNASCAVIFASALLTLSTSLLSLASVSVNFCSVVDDSFNLLSSVKRSLAASSADV